MLERGAFKAEATKLKLPPWTSTYCIISYFKTKPNKQKISLAVDVQFEIFFLSIKIQIGDYFLYKLS